jgi:hypothetical protein
VRGASVRWMSHLISFVRFIRIALGQVARYGALQLLATRALACFFFHPLCFVCVSRSSQVFSPVRARFASQTSSPARADFLPGEFCPLLPPRPKLLFVCETRLSCLSLSPHPHPRPRRLTSLSTPPPLPSGPPLAPALASTLSLTSIAPLPLPPPIP